MNFATVCLLKMNILAAIHHPMRMKEKKELNFTCVCASMFSWRLLNLVTDVRSPNWSALVGAFIGWWRNTFSVFHFFVWICCSNQSLSSFIFLPIFRFFKRICKCSKRVRFDCLLSKRTRNLTASITYTNPSWITPINWS